MDALNDDWTSASGSEGTLISPEGLKLGLTLTGRMLGRLDGFSLDKETMLGACAEGIDVSIGTVGGTMFEGAN